MFPLRRRPVHPAVEVPEIPALRPLILWFLVLNPFRDCCRLLRYRMKTTLQTPYFIKVVPWRTLTSHRAESKPVQECDANLRRESLKVVLPTELAHLMNDACFAEITTHDRRREPRLRLVTKTALDIELTPGNVENTEKFSTALVRDISCHGICILWHRPVEVGSIIFLRFQGRQIRAKVQRCRELGEKCYECGCEMIYFRNFESG